MLIIIIIYYNLVASLALILLHNSAESEKLSTADHSPLGLMAPYPRVLVTT